MQIPIQLDGHGRSILGMLHVPRQRATGSPVLLLNYGLNGDRVDNHRLSILLANHATAAGITVVRFDYQGCGLSTGDFFSTSLATKTADTLAVIEFIKGCFLSEEFKLILLAYSDGIRIIHHVLKTGDVAAFCGWNPIVRSMTETFKASKGNRPTIEPSTKKLVFPLFGLYMGIDYLKEVNEHLEIADLLDNNLPKLFVFGSGDRHTLEFQKEMKALREQRFDFDLCEIAGANHLFNRVEWCEELVSKTVEWVLNVSN